MPLPDTLKSGEQLQAWEQRRRESSCRRGSSCRSGSSAGVGAAQAALAWCPLLPMRMLLPRSPFTYIYTVISSYGGWFFFLGRGRRKRRAVVNRRQ